MFGESDRAFSIDKTNFWWIFLIKINAEKITVVNKAKKTKFYLKLKNHAEFWARSKNASCS